MEELKIYFNIEKRDGFGEDGDPISLSIPKDNIEAVGVFDGMGGAGATFCNWKDEKQHTQAYVASRIVRDAVEDYLKTSGKTFSAKEMKTAISVTYQQQKKDFPSKSSGLRCKLVREFPTTMAVCIINRKSDDGKYSVTSLWAGDSRNYLWTKNGFYLISQDDLDQPLDPMQNLREDAAMSNCICADREFHINQCSVVDIEEPFIVFSATDGCFGYFPTPMHFENMLKEGLKQSQNKEEWELNIKEKIKLVAADDISMSLMAIGFKDFVELRSFSSKYVRGLDDILKLEGEISDLKRTLENKKQQLEENIQKGWEIYKPYLMSQLSSKKDVNDDTSNQNHQGGGDERPEDNPEGKSFKGLNYPNKHGIEESNNSVKSGNTHNSISEKNVPKDKKNNGKNQNRKKRNKHRKS